MAECDHPTCRNEAYTTIEATDPNGHSETFNLCGIHREEIWDNSLYETTDVDKLKKERTAY